MDTEFFDDRHRSKWVIALGVVLALVAGGAAFVLINQAQQQAGLQNAERIRAVVAVQAIPARSIIEADDLEVREIPIDPTNASGIFTDPAAVIGRIPAVSVLQGQLITSNMLASSNEGGEFSILGPDESFGPDTPAWRAVSLTVPDDLAVGGLLQAGQSVDVFVTVGIAVPQTLVEDGRYVSERSTKVAYQDMVILAREGAFYIVRATVDIAEEITHLQATGAATFSLALRPTEDTRHADATALGETTNRIIQKYGLPIPEAYPAGRGPIQTPVPLPTPTQGPAASPDAAATVPAQPSTTPTP
jgi:Flp pilus assembly protein CpaB